MVEYLTGSGEKINLIEFANQLTKRVISLFNKDEKDERNIFGAHNWCYKKPENKHLLLFYEYFPGDSGKGLGASHQPGGRH